MSRSRTHLAQLQSAVRRPADVWLLARILGWSLALPVAKSLLSVPRLTLLMRTDARTAARDREREETVVSLTAWVFKTRPRNSRDNCLERALVTYRYLCRAGARPEFVMGVGRGDQGVHGHAWVTVDGRPVHDEPAALAPFQPILRFTSDGRMVRLPA